MRATSASPATTRFACAPPPRPWTPGRALAALVLLSAALGWARSATATCATTHLTVAINAVTAALGQYVPVTIRAWDATPALTTCYTGTVTFTSTDSGFIVSSTNPSVSTTPVTTYTFTGGDSGQHVFYVKFATPGFQTLTATDSTLSTPAATSPNLTVAAVLFSSGANNYDFSQNFTVTTAVGSSSVQNLTVQLSSSVMFASAALNTGFGSTGANDFSVGTANCNTSGTVESCTIAVTFQPSRPGLRQAPLVITDTNNNKYYLGLSGVGAGGALAFTPGIIQSVKTFSSPDSLTFGAIDSAGNEYLADNQSSGKVEELSSSGTLTVLAGGGSGTTFPAAATSVALHGPTAVHPDAAGNLYIADAGDNVVLKLDRNTGQIVTVAGTYINGIGSFSGDGGGATSATLSFPSDVAIAGDGTLYIADALNHAVRKVDPQTGLTSTYVGNCGASSCTQGFPTSGHAAIGSSIGQPEGLALDTAGDLYITDYLDHEVYRVDHSTGILTVFAGNGTAGNQGNGNAANDVNTELNKPNGIAVDTAGNVYIADSAANVVRRVDATANNNATPGIIHTIAGGGSPAAGIGDNHAATDASLNNPQGVWLDSVGTVYIGDGGDDEIRSIAVTLGQLDDFKSALLGTTSTPQSLLITNVGNQNFNISSFQVSSTNSPADFAQDTPTTTCGGSALAPGVSCVYGVDFTPQHLGFDTGTAAVANDAAGGNAQATLTGTGVQASVSPTSATFASTGTGVVSAAQTFTFTNPSTSGQPISFTSVALSGANASDFSITSNGCTGSIGSSGCTVQVTYTPTTINTETAALTFTDAATNSPQTVSLTGAILVAPTGMSVNAGNNQSAVTGTQFANTFQVLVTGSGSTPAPNIQVTFTAPSSSSGGSGVFTDTGTTSTTAYTNAAGIATAAAFMANGATGTYTISAVATKDATGATISSPSTSLSETNTALSQAVGSTSSTKMTFTFVPGAAISAIAVLTDGAASQDFTQHSGNASACATDTSYSAGASCTVQVDFTPKAPGLRRGAVVLYNGTLPPYTPFKTIYFSAIGTGPALTFNPGAPASSAALSSLNKPIGVKADAAGDLFVVDSGNKQVLELSSGGTLTTVASGSNITAAPQGIALDGAGNVYFVAGTSSLSDRLFHATRYADGTYAFPAGSSSYTTLSTKTPSGVAVDGAGNVYVSYHISTTSAGILNTTVSTSTPITVTGVTLKTPEGMAIDASGNLYVADPGLATPGVVKIVLATGAATEISTPGITLTSPTAVAVDAAGDLYIADSGAKAVYELPASGGNAITLSGNLTLAASGPLGVAVDGAGNAYVPDSGTSTNASVYKLDLHDAPALAAFPSTGVGAASAAEIVTATNIGNANLSFSSIAVGTSNFSTGGTTCSTSAALISGSNCLLGATFTPQTLSPPSDTLTVKDNTLNAANTTTTFALSGTATVGPAAKLAFSQQPIGTTIGSSISPAVTVKVEDIAGDLVTTDTSAVTIAIGSNPGSATLGGTLTVNAVGGIATFSSLSVSAVGTGYTLSASDGSLTSATSSAFNITGPTQLALIINSTATASFGENFTVQAEDSSGNPVPGYVGTVHFTSTDARAELPANYTFTTADGGMHIFSGGADFLTTGSQTISASDGSLSATSGAVAVSTLQEPVGSTSSALTTTITISTAGTSAAINVLTSGNSSGDFTAASGGSCTTAHAYSTGATCTVNLTFKPTASGLRAGAVTLTSSGGTVLGTAYFYGIGQAPVVTFAPSAGSVASATIGSGLLGIHGIVRDGNGTLYLAASGTHVYSYDTTAHIVATGVSITNPVGVAVDGAGNLLILDQGTRALYELAPGSSTATTVSAPSGGYLKPMAIAVDGAGNVYVADYTANEIFKLTAGTFTSSVYMASSYGYRPQSLALDGADNLFFATGTAGVYEIPAGGGAPVLVANTSVHNASNVAVDAAGDLYTNDGNTVYDLPAQSAATITLATGVNPAGMISDGQGNLYVADAVDGEVWELKLSSPPTLAAFSSSYGVASAATTITVGNAGNAALNISGLAFTTGASYNSNGTSTTCSNTTALAAAGAAPAGTCTLVLVFQPAAVGTLNDTYTLTDNQLNATSATQAIALSGTATQATQTISFNPPASVTYGAAPITLSATGGASGNPVTFSVVSGQGSVAGTNNATLTFTGAGSVTVASDQAGTSNYAAATTVQKTITINKANDTVNFVAVATQTYPVSGTITLAATGASTGAISYQVISGAATISGSALTIAGAGAVVIEADQAADANYNAGSAQQTVTVNKGADTVNFPAVATQTYPVSGTLTLAATGASTGAITYQVISGPATVSGSALTITGAGSVVLEADQAADSNYNAGSAQQTVTVNKGADTVNFTTVATQTYPVSGSITLAATGTSTGAISYQVISGSATISGSALTIAGAGAVVIEADQAADSNYNAGSAQQTVTVDKGADTVNFTAVATQTYPVSGTLTLAATGTSTGAITYRVISGTATLSGSSLTITGAGAVVLEADQAADSNYNAGSTQQTVTVSKGADRVTFTPVAAPTFPVSGPITLAATGLSTGAITFSVTSGPGTVSGNQLTVTGVGTIMVAANQAADANYLAGSAQQSIVVAAGVSMTLSGTALNFGSVPLGSSSTPQSVILTNTGTAPVQMASTAASGDFSAASNCPSIAVGATCTINVVFTPTATGSRAGTLTLTDNAPGSPQTLALTGTGTAAGVVVTPTRLVFGSQQVGSTSTSQTVTILNTGTAALHVASITVTGDFAANGNCALVPAGSNCSFSVSFTPTATGMRTGTATVTDDAGGGSQLIQLSGSGTVAGAALSPATLVFPGTPLGAQSAVQTATLTNTGTAALTGISATVAGDFTLSNACGATLAAGQSCVLSVRFTPALSGAEAGAVTVADNLGQQTLALSGTGLTAGASLSNAQLIFGGQLVGTTSSAQTVVLTNTGSAALTITSITASSGFAFNSNCTATTIAAAGTCTINVSFAPAAAGPAAGTVSVLSSAGTSTVSLQGQGTNPGLALTPSFAIFGAQAVGTASLARTFTLTNTGTVGLTLAPIAVSSDFAESDQCPATLNAGASCLISVSFTPTATGNRAGALTVSDTGGLASALTTLAGPGTLPGVSLSPAALDFGSLAVGSTSDAQTVTVTNTGTAPLVISGVTASGDFAENDNCTTAPIAAGGYCVIGITMTPTTIGSRTGAVQITDNTNGTETVALSGDGQAPGISVYPTSLNFGSFPIPGAGQAASLSGTLLSVTLTNTGNLPLTLNGYGLQGDFSQTNGCGTSLAPQTSCTLTVAFNPTALGHRTGTLTITDNAGSGSQTVALQGDGSPGGLTLTPPVLNFGTQVVGVTSQPLAATLTNNTGSDITNLVITPSGEYNETNSCGATLANGSNCQLFITITPVTTGAITGTITVTGTIASQSSAHVLAAERPQAGNQANFSLGVVAVTATAIPPGISFSVPQLSFSVTAVGTASTGQTITIQNTGNTLNLTDLSISGTNTSEFPFTTTCPKTLAPQATCTITVTFAPTGAGLRTGFIDLKADGGVAARLPESGTGIGPLLTAAPSSLSYGPRPVATTSAAQTVLLQNTGGLPLSLTGIAASGDFQVVATTCSLPQTLADNSTCTVSVVFTPTLTGSRSGALTLKSNSTSGDVIVALNGSGNDAGLSFSASSLAFGNQGVGVASAAQTITVTNPGSGAQTINAIAIAPAGEFTETTNCPASLAAGASCTIQVVFKPTATGAHNATLAVTSGAGTQNLGLAGSGSDFALNWSGSLPAAVTVGAGSVTTYNLSASSLSGDSQTIALSCQADPGFTCSVAPTQVTIGAQPGAFTLKLVSTARVTGAAATGSGPSNPWRPAAQLLFALGLLLTLAGIGKQRKLSLAGLGLLVVMSAACAGNTPPQNPSISHVTVTAVSATGATHAKTLDLRVD